MTGLTSPDDDLLRRALAAEAEGVDARAELLARTREAVARCVARRRHRLVLLAAAVVVLVAGTVALLDARRGDDVRIEPAPPAGDDRPEGEPPEDGYPGLIAAVREDGMLITIDTATDRQRELHSEGHPTADNGGVAHQFIQTVDLSPDGRWVYFTRCCEPAVGTIFRMPVAGGAVEEIGPGSYPKVSPDGRYLAFTCGQSIRVSPIGGGAPVTFETGMPAEGVVWSPGGTELAVTVRANDGGAPTVQTYRFDGESLSIEPTGRTFPQASHVLWEPGETPGWVTEFGGSIGDGLGVSQDASYDWIIRVDKDGVVQEEHGFTAGVTTPIAGGAACDCGRLVAARVTIPASGPPGVVVPGRRR